MRFEIFEFDSVTSTNDEAINLIKKRKKNSGLVYANTQTNGRGTQGKKWISKKGNFFGSIFFKLKDTYPPFNEFSIINSVILSDIIKSFSYEKKISIKFPNDIFLNEKKVCGILQELITLRGEKYLIVGMGINLSSNPKINANYVATNILLEVKKKPKIVEIIQLIVSSYEKFFINLNSYDFIYYKKKADLIVLN